MHRVYATARVGRSDHPCGDFLNGDHLNGDHLNGDHLNGDHLNGDHLNGDHLNGDYLNSDTNWVRLPKKVNTWPGDTDTDRS
jgi:hypothetical protein